jgi:hypothetical protein
MPYSAGNRLPGERASRLGHLEVLKSELVNRLCESFENPESTSEPSNAVWETIPSTGTPLRIVFGVDGSMQPIRSETQPYKELAFVKTAILKVDSVALAKVDRENPHPFALRDIMADSACHHATVFPLKNVTIPGISVYHAIRQIIFDSIKDASLEGEPMETLKWIAYRKWDIQPKQLPLFGCPHCEETVATLPYDAEEGSCPSCGNHLFLTDMLGFHLEMAEDSAPQSLAMSYMGVHETLLLFTAIRHFWHEHPKLLAKCLFVKDGPLYLRAQYSKLVNPIRDFLVHAEDSGHPVHLIGQEKTGKFHDHLQMIGRDAPVGCLFIPDGDYITKEINHRPDSKTPYGKDTNYGVKVFVKLNEYHQMVLSIPTSKNVKNPYNESPKLEDLIGTENIFATLPELLSYRHEGGLLPVELANGVASLSTYPSAQILKMFAEESIKTST